MVPKEDALVIEEETESELATIDDAISADEVRACLCSKGFFNRRLAREDLGVALPAFSGC